MHWGSIGWWVLWVLWLCSGSSGSCCIIGAANAQSNRSQASGAGPVGGGREVVRGRRDIDARVEHGLGVRRAVPALGSIVEAADYVRPRWAEERGGAGRRG